MKKEYLQIRISKNCKDMLEQLCRQEQCSKSEWIRNIINLEYYLMERKKNKNAGE